MKLEEFVKNGLTSTEKINEVELTHFVDSFVYMSNETIDREKWKPDDKKRLILYSDSEESCVTLLEKHTILSVDNNVSLLHALLFITTVLDSKDVRNAIIDELASDDESPLWTWEQMALLRESLLDRREGRFLMTESIIKNDEKIQKVLKESRGNNDPIKDHKTFLEILFDAFRFSEKFSVMCLLTEYVSNMSPSEGIETLELASGLSMSHIMDISYEEEAVDAICELVERFKLR